MHFIALTILAASSLAAVSLNAEEHQRAEGMKVFLFIRPTTLAR